MSEVYGSLCLSATTPQKDFPQFIQGPPFVFEGHHTPHKFRGYYTIVGKGEVSSSTFHVPSRQKSFLILTASNYEFSSKANDLMSEWLPQMESQYEGARQLYKFNAVQKELKAVPSSQAFVSTIVNTGEHGHIAVLAQWRDVYVYGVYDTENFGVRLVWTTDEWFINDVRAHDFPRYVFYRFPVLQDRPLFLYGQALCSKWWGWTKQFQGPDGVLKAFCALENFLYKEAELPQLQVTNGNRPAHSG